MLKRKNYGKPVVKAETPKRRRTTRQTSSKKFVAAQSKSAVTGKGQVKGARRKIVSKDVTGESSLVDWDNLPRDSDEKRGGTSP